jgi:hypothetical protein
VVAAALTTDPSWMCVDGFDDEGNMVGGCEEDEWTLAPVASAAGLALSSVGTALAGVWARRQPR